MGAANAITAAAPRTADGYLTIPISQLRPGSRLHHPLYDARAGARQLLLADGKQLTSSHLDNLKQRGIVSVLIHPSDLSSSNEARASTFPSQRSPASSQPPATADASSHQETNNGWSGLSADPGAFIHKMQPPQMGSRDPVRCAKFQASYDAGVNTATTVMSNLVREHALTADVVVRVSEGHLRELAEDIDEFLFRGTSPVHADYPSRHSLQTAMLATTMGALMGYRRDELLDLGFGCMVHDVGMLLVTEGVAESPTVLSAVERLDLQKHPILAADLLNQCRNVPSAARQIVYQMHERMNGSGYPRGRSGNQIHPLARVAGVADTFLALISPRPFRPPLAPYQAIERILFATRQGLFDVNAVRALLNAVSLFPIGSYVRLSDGRLAQVIRGNREQFAQPLVQIFEPPYNESGELIDLRHQSGLKVVSAAESPAAVSSAHASQEQALQTAAAHL